jgi:hypothetical protein
MNIALHILLILISFSIAFFGVVILFSVDVLAGFILAVAGIGLSMAVVHNV